MSAWKKIASMFALAASTALLGAACTAEVGDTTEPLDPATQVEGTDEAESALTIDPADRDRDRDWDRDHGNRFRCERYCQREYRECRARFDHDDLRDRHHDGRGRFCRHRYEHCISQCHFHH